MIATWFVDSLHNGTLEYKAASYDADAKTFTVTFKVKNQPKVAVLDVSNCILYAMAVKSHKNKFHAKASLDRVMRDYPDASPTDLAEHWLTRCKRTAALSTDLPQPLELVKYV